MSDWFRNFRLGVVDILGITVPGILLILFVTGGFFLPLTCLVIPLSQGVVGSDLCLNWHRAACFWESNRTLILLFGIIFAYLLGSILRLISPSRLDKESAKHVIADLGSEEVKHWPIQDVETDKYPYLYFRRYLKYRGHEKLLELIPWGSSEEEGHKKSSTHIQMMKLEVMLKAPELSALLESKEAHVRLLSGTWGAINSTKALVCVGIALSIVGYVLAYLGQGNPRLPPAPYGLCLLVSGAIGMVMLWSKRTIERLFHYQRVRELFLIVASVYQVQMKEEPDKKQRQQILNQHDS